MKRKEFLKILPLVPFAGVAVVKAAAGTRGEVYLNDLAAQLSKENIEKLYREIYKHGHQVKYFCLSSQELAFNRHITHGKLFGIEVRTMPWETMPPIEMPEKLSMSCIGEDTEYAWDKIKQEWKEIEKKCAEAIS